MLSTVQCRLAVDLMIKLSKVARDCESESIQCTMTTYNEVADERPATLHGCNCVYVIATHNGAGLSLQSK